LCVYTVKASRALASIGRMICIKGDCVNVERGNASASKDCPATSNRMAAKGKEYRKNDGKRGPAREKESRCNSQGKKKKVIVAGSRCRARMEPLIPSGPWMESTASYALVSRTSLVKHSMLCEANQPVRR